MPTRYIVSVVLISCLSGFAVSGDPFPSSHPDRLDFSPRKMIQERARGKARALARRLDLEKLLAPTPADIDDYDATYYDIFWQPDFSDSSIYGEVTLHARSTVDNLTEVQLYLDSRMEIDTAYNDAGRIPCSHLGGLVTAYLDRAYAADEEFQFTIVYHGQPPPLYEWFGGLMFTHHAGVPICENLSEPYDARLWWPCKDVPWDKADSVDVRATIDTGFIATSNGLLLSDVDNGDGTHTVHWSHRYPITTYNVCLAVTDFVHERDWYVYSETDSLPIDNYVFPEHLGDPSFSYDVTPTAIAVLSDLFVEYPFIEEKYGHTECNVHGMEHQVNTFLNYYFLCDEPTVVHELGHHWWGNLVTCETWHDVWLNEGFGTYCEPLFYEVMYGKDYFKAYMQDIEYRDSGTVYVDDITDPWVIFDWRSYAKGAWVLHMLRGVLGDSLFFAGMREYAATFAYGTATSDEFQAVVETVSERDLDYFFDEWLHGEYFPKYLFSYMVEADPVEGWNTYVHMRQYQTTDPDLFIMPVQLGLTTTTGFETQIVFNDRREQTFSLHTDDEVVALDFDPDKWILSSKTWGNFTFHIITEELGPACRACYFEDTVIAKGGSNTYSCELVSGDLPDGWTLDNASGIIAGTCYEAGTYAFAIGAVDLVFPQFYSDTMEYVVAVELTSFTPGDADGDDNVSIADAVYIVNYIFKNGPPPLELNLADANADCAINVGDAVYIINYIFAGGPPPSMGCVE